LSVDCWLVAVVIVEDAMKHYLMPFEAEVGLHPSLEVMQDVVVAQKLRPQFRANWLQDVVRLNTFIFSCAALVKFI